jgi:hypothetical protein
MLMAIALLSIPAAAQSPHSESYAPASSTALKPIGIFAAPQGTVGFGDAYSFIAHTSDPSKCVAGNVEFNLTSATPKYCSAPNTWTPFASGGAGGSTVNSGTQFAFGEYATSGTAISSGPTPPSVNGIYFCGYSVTGSVAVAPSCWLNSLGPRAVTGSTSTDTILFTDSVVEYQGSVAVATALPTPATLGNPGFYAKLVNTTSGSSTAVTVTAAGSFNFSSTGTGTLVIPQGQSCSLLVDPAGSVWDDTCADLAWTAGTNITITRGRYGPTISASGGGGVTSFSGDGAFATNSASTGGVTLTLANAGAHKWWGNNTGSTAAPGYESLASADIPNNAANTTGNSATATALVATPSQCSGSQFAQGIAASGNANCASIPTLNQSTTGNAATASALAATPAQCSGSQYATGITASGNANCSTPSGGSAFAAATTTLFDDFMSNSTTSTLGFAGNGGGGSITSQPNGTGQVFTNHPGIAELSSGGSAGGTDWEYYILGNQNNPEVNPTLNSFTIFGDFMVGTNSTTFPNGTTRFGMFDHTSMNQEAPNSGVYFEAVNNGSTAQNWNCVVNTSGTPTSTSSGVTAAENAFNILEIVFNATTTPTFYINGSQVCSSLSATIPSTLMDAAFDATDNSNGAAQLLIDYFAVTWNLTR